MASHDGHCHITLSIVSSNFTLLSTILVAFCNFYIRKPSDCWTKLIWDENDQFSDKNIPIHILSITSISLIFKPPACIIRRTPAVFTCKICEKF